MRLIDYSVLLFIFTILVSSCQRKEETVLEYLNNPKKEPFKKIGDTAIYVKSLNYNSIRVETLNSKILYLDKKSYERFIVDRHFQSFFDYSEREKIDIGKSLFNHECLSCHADFNSKWNGKKVNDSLLRYLFISEVPQLIEFHSNSFLKIDMKNQHSFYFILPENAKRFLTYYLKQNINE